jgi:hypothetical protein
MNKRVPGKLARSWVAGVLAALALGFVADWAAWRLRGDPMGEVVVTRVVVAPLKGNREEYYADGTATVACSRTLYPQAGAGACWWVRRHREIEER